MGKTTAQKDGHVVKDGIRQKDVYATAVGDTTKAYFLYYTTLLSCHILPLPILFSTLPYCNTTLQFQQYYTMVLYHDINIIVYLMQCHAMQLYDI